MRSHAKQGNRKRRIRVKDKEGNVLKNEDGSPMTVGVPMPYGSARGNNRRFFAARVWQMERKRLEDERRMEEDHLVALMGRGIG